MSLKTSAVGVSQLSPLRALCRKARGVGEDFTLATVNAGNPLAWHSGTGGEGGGWGSLGPVHLGPEIRSLDSTLVLNAPFASDGLLYCSRSILVMFVG